MSVPQLAPQEEASFLGFPQVQHHLKLQIIKNIKTLTKKEGFIDNTALRAVCWRIWEQGLLGRQALTRLNMHHLLAVADMESIWLLFTLENDTLPLS